MKIIKASAVIFFTTVLFTSCISIKNTEVAKPENLITKERADQLHEAYLNNQYAFINKELGSDERDNVGALVTNVEDLQLFLESIIALKKQDSVAAVGMFVYFGAEESGSGAAKSTVFFEAAYAPKTKTSRRASGGGASFTPVNFITLPQDDSFLPAGGDGGYYDKLHPVGTRKKGSGN